MPFGLSYLDGYYGTLSENLNSLLGGGSLIGIFLIICWWFLFKKAKEPGWASLIPFYNTYVLFKITWGNGWLFLLNLLVIIPILGWIAVFVINIITYVKLGKVFGKSGGFILGLLFLGVIFLPILAFGDSKYKSIRK